MKRIVLTREQVDEAVVDYAKKHGLIPQGGILTYKPVTLEKDIGWEVIWHPAQEGTA